MPLGAVDVPARHTCWLLAMAACPMATIPQGGVHRELPARVTEGGVRFCVSGYRKLVRNGSNSLGSEALASLFFVWVCQLERIQASGSDGGGAHLHNGRVEGVWADWRGGRARRSRSVGCGAGLGRGEEVLLCLAARRAHARAAPDGHCVMILRRGVNRRLSGQAQGHL